MLAQDPREGQRAHLHRATGLAADARLLLHEGAPLRYCVADPEVGLALDLGDANLQQLQRAGRLQPERLRR